MGSSCGQQNPTKASDQSGSCPILVRSLNSAMAGRTTCLAISPTFVSDHEERRKHPIHAFCAATAVDKASTDDYLFHSTIIYYFSPLFGYRRTNGVLFTDIFTQQIIAGIS